MRSPLIAALFASSLALADGRPVHAPVHVPPPPPPPSAPTSPDTAKPFWCRGPLSYSPGSTLHVYVKRSTLAAGDQGQNLSPGTCAWGDGPLADNSPVDLIAVYHNHSVATDAETSINGDWAAAAVAALAPALLSKDMLIGFAGTYLDGTFIKVKGNIYVKPIGF